MDGGSTDNTVSILTRRDAEITVWESSPDRGVYDAWNKAIDKATGDWICFLGADDFLWSPGVFTKALPHLNKAKEQQVRVVYGQIASISKEGALLGFRGSPWETVRERFCWEMCIPHPGLFHHRELFSQHGKFDDSYRIAGDYEFLLRELKTESAIFIPDLVTVGFREGGLSNRPDLAALALREMKRARKAHQQSAPFRYRFSTTHMKIIVAALLYQVFGLERAQRILGWIKTKKIASR